MDAVNRHARTGTPWIEFQSPGQVIPRLNLAIYMSSITFPEKRRG